MTTDRAAKIKERMAERAAEPHLFDAIPIDNAYRENGVVELCRVCTKPADWSVHFKALATSIGISDMLYEVVKAVDNTVTKLQAAIASQVVFRHALAEIDRLRLVNAGAEGDYEEAARFSAYSELEDIFRQAICVLTPTDHVVVGDEW